MTHIKPISFLVLPEKNAARFSEQKMKKKSNWGEKLSFFALKCEFLHKICECFKLPLTMRIYMPESLWIKPNTNDQILFANPQFLKKILKLGVLSPILAPKMRFYAPNFAYTPKDTHFQCQNAFGLYLKKTPDDFF